MSLSATQQKRTLRRSVAFVTAISAVAAVVTGACAALGDERAALGVLCGHAIALVCGLTWIVAATLTFDAPFTPFARATLGLAPVRLAIVASGITVAAVLGQARVDLLALAVSFVATELLLQLVQADCFLRLSAKQGPKSKATFGGVRFSGVKLWR